MSEQRDGDLRQPADSEPSEGDDFLVEFAIQVFEGKTSEARLTPRERALTVSALRRLSERAGAVTAASTYPCPNPRCASWDCAKHDPATRPTLERGATDNV